ncbi:condensin-2 complex subunit D3-L-like isoform X1 [Watersipora subatra]|uniref:condensin-2 complex subunit D3-L-like isoform X1 n=1 Tax=Watersipora subatra TaxID=2589382 RepID=UPI00355B781E
MIKEAFSSLQQNLLMLVGLRKESLSTIPRETVMVKDQALDFVLHMMQAGGDNIRIPLHRLVRSTILSTPDRSEYRVKVSQAVLRIMEKMSSLLYSETCKWIFELSKYKKVAGRMLAVEIIGPLLISSDFRIIEETPALGTELIHYTSRPVLLQALLMRCSDKAVSVMAKALSMVALCLNCNDGPASNEIRCFITRYSSNPLIGVRRIQSNITAVTENPERASIDSRNARGESNNTIETVATASCSEVRVSNFTRYEFARSSNPTSCATFYLTRGFDITLTDSEGLISLIKRRLHLPKAIVRKAALQALENVIIYNEGIGMSKELQVLQEHCRDVAVPNRKQAMQSLTRILQLYPANPDAQMAWLTGILSAHDDSEASVQEKCCDFVKSIVWDPIHLGKDMELAWQLCSNMLKEKRLFPPRMLHSICVQLHKREDLPDELIDILTRFISSEYGKEAWLLLSIVCSITSIKHGKMADFLANQWLEGFSAMSESVVQHALTTLSVLAAQICSLKRQRLIADLLCRLKSFSSPIKFIKPMVVALSQLVKADGAGNDWVKEIVDLTEHFLSGIIYADGYDSKAVERMPCYLITLGEACLYCPQILSQSIIQLVQSLLVLPKISGEQKRLGLLADMASGLLPSSIRSAALLCLGQISIQHEAVAKRNIPTLAAELETSNDAAFSKAVVIILCDLCRLYTNAVGPYTSSISSSLRHRDAEVRQNTFVSMTRLLQEDFLKWSGPLFYRFISCIVDDNAAIAELAKQTFIYELSKRNKSMYLQHFVECLFFFNNYTTHERYNKFPQTNAERALFSLSQEANASKRQRIYNFMLDHMSDLHKFNATQRLCQDIVSATIEKELALKTNEGAAVLVDALSILQGKNIKLSVTRAPSSGAPMDEDLTPSQGSSKATVAVVTKIVRKNFVENIIPDIISLKAVLEANHSPIMKHLMLFLIEITKDYKAELADALAGNEQLAAELAFDIRKFEEKALLEEEEASEEPIEAQATVVNTPAMRTPVMPATVSDKRTPLNCSLSTPTNQVARSIPRPQSASVTPAMPPPPPLRSALKKPTSTVRQLSVSVKKLAQVASQSTSSGSGGHLAKRVNFDDDGENEANQPEVTSTRDLPNRLSRTPLRVIVSAAVGARAISTPDGNLADLTFAGNTSKFLTPIMAVSRLEDERKSGHLQNKFNSNLPLDPLVQMWNIKSPLQKKKRPKSKALISRDSTSELELTSDPLITLNLDGKNKSRRRKAGKKFKK